MSETDTVPRFAANHAERLGKLDQIADDTRRAIERLDRALERFDTRLDSHFRWLLGIMLAGFGALLGVMAHGFHWIP